MALIMAVGRTTTDDTMVAGIDAFLAGPLIADLNDYEKPSSSC